jgi:GNAT superfamily N-acetyltransferase
MPSPACEIRPRRPEDRGALERLDTSFTTTTRLELERDGLSFRWVERPLRRPFHKRFTLDLDAATPSLALCAWIGDRLAGYAEAVREDWNRRLRLEHLYVDAGARHGGVGRVLLEEVVDRAPSLDVRGVWLETQDVNPAAVRFYLSHGFKLCGWDDSLFDPAGEAAGETALFLYQALASTG